MLNNQCRGALWIQIIREWSVDFYVVFSGAPQGLVHALLMLFKIQKQRQQNGPQRSKKIKARNWKVTGKTEVELIISVFGKHSSTKSKLFKVYRVLQMSGYSSPWFLSQTNHSRQPMLKEASRLLSSGLHPTPPRHLIRCTEASADLLVQIAERKFSYRANKLSSGPRRTVIAVKRAMTASIDHSTSVLLMHVKRSGLAN